MVNKAQGRETPETRDRLLKIADALFTEKGLEGVTLRAVAREAGLTPMAIYRHFDDKQALVRELFQLGFDEYARYLAIDQLSDPVEHLEALAGRVFDFSIEKSAYFELMFLTSKSVTGFSQQQMLHEVQKPTYAIAARAIRDCRDAGQMDVDSIKNRTNDVLAWCIGFSASYLSGAMAGNATRARVQFKISFRRVIAPYLL